MLRGGGNTSVKTQVTNLLGERVPAIFVKASGYVTDIDKTLALYEAGARRFGTAFTVDILEGLRRRLAGR